MKFSDLLHQKLHDNPQEGVIDYAGRSFAQREIAGFGDRLISLLEGAGVPADAAVGCVMRNRPLQAAVMLGLIAADRPLTTIYAFQAPALLAADIVQTRFAAVVADAGDLSPEVLDAIRAVGGVAISLSLEDGVPISFVPGLDRFGGGGYHRIDGEPSFEILSSGTTGKPKRIRVPFRMLVRTVETVKGGQLAASLPPDICTWPLSGIGGVTNLVANILVDRHMTLLDRFNVPEWVEAVMRKGPSYVTGPPAVAQMIVDAKVPAEALKSIKWFYGGSAPLPTGLEEKLFEIYGIRTLWSYGATEFCGGVTSWTPDLYEKYAATKKNSMGKALPGVTLRVVDIVTGEPVPVGTEGYLEALVPAVADDWIRTTDLVVMDEDEFLYHRGRGDGAIMRGGFKIVPEVVVDAILRHPSVFDACVVGLPDPRLGQVPVAAVQLKTGASATGEPEVLEFLRSELAATYIPRRVLIVETLPRTQSLKIDRRAVEALLSQLFEGAHDN